MVREIEAHELHDLVRLPYVAHQVDPARVERVWVHGGAVVVQAAPSRPGVPTPGATCTCLGPADDLGHLMAALAADGVRTDRLTVEQPAELPATWVLTSSHDWLWMTTRELGPPADAPAWRPEQLDGVRDAVEIDELLDAANADSFARPGQPGVEVWWGIRERAPHSSRLLAAGALQRMHDGTLHMRGLGVLPENRGSGAGRALSAALTRHSLAHGSGVATLGVYADNQVALRMYETLGYRTVHRFRSGPLAP